MEAELRSIRITSSLYTINFKKTPNYYKPGMSFDITVNCLFILYLFQETVMVNKLHNITT